jgi:SAM-dependent methyltransferase
VRAGAIHAAARGFELAPKPYEIGRPTYPPDAVERLVSELGIGPGKRVLDLAAGTGKLTRLLVPTGAELVAVEPVEGMRGALSASLPGVEALAGTAESIPLPDASVDAVTVGQAFHWFDGDAALAEIHRVLRPSGRLGLIWNVKDESVDWIEKLGGIMESYRGDAPRVASGAWKDAFDRTKLFAPLQRARFSFVHEADFAAVVARVTSVSFIAALPPAEFARVVDRVRTLLGTHPETKGRSTFELPYRTGVYWTSRTGRRS